MSINNLVKLFLKLIILKKAETLQQRYFLLSFIIVYVVLLFLTHQVVVF